MSETASLDGWHKMPRAIYELGLTGNQIALYGALMSFADNRGQCFPSYKALAERAGMSEKTVKRGLRVLASKGVVTVANRVTQGGGATSNFYTITTPTPRVMMTYPPGHSVLPPRSQCPTPQVMMTPPRS
ncbi:helix-turn-helix domain-containing protein [Actinotignum urinale]|uniref:helix-turn-helix domain-containing protein n=1 Tax=Actinotignum urinale TaxID=190146 RepID=UPI00389B11B4